MATLELKHYAHKVGVNVHHFEWCTKYGYMMFKQDKYKKVLAKKFSEKPRKDTV